VATFAKVELARRARSKKSLEVWSDGGGIRGILFTYSGGDAIMHGIQFGHSPQSITFAPGEKVLAATLWGNGRAEVLGHIYLKTDKQEFDVGMEKPNGGYQLAVGGGLLLGAYGASGTYINGLALLFLSKEISSATISGVKFDSDPAGTSDNIAPSYLVQSTFGNPPGSQGSVSFTMSGSESVSQSTTWEQSTTSKFGGNLEIKVGAKAFGIGGETTAGFNWSVAHTGSNGATTTDTITITQSIGPISIAPGYGKACKIFAQKGNGTFPYTSTVTLNLKDGGSIQYQEHGKLVSVQYSHAIASCVDANNFKDWDTTTNNPPPSVKIVRTGNNH